MSVFSTVESKFTSLRKKLDQMGYLQPLGLESVPLGERLYTDLLHSTEALNNYKEQNLALVEEKAHLIKQVEPLKDENAKLVKEVNELNLKLLNQNEKFEESIKELKSNVRKLEHENSDLRFLNTQYYHKLQALERESSQKSELIMSLQEKQPQAVVLVSGKKATLAFRRQKMEIDSMLHSGVSKQILHKVQEQSQDIYVADLLRIADSRAEKLEEEKKKLLESMEEAENALTDLQKQVASRDKEITRLNRMLDGGRPVEAIISEARLEANDNVVASLQIQVECLQRENIELENKLSDLEGKVRRHPATSKGEEYREKLPTKRVPQRQESYKNQPKFARETKSSETLVKRHAEIEKRNKSLQAMLKNKDEEKVKLDTMIKALKKDKEDLEKKLKQMSENEKDLIMEIDRLSRRKVDQLSERHSPEHLQQLIQILEAQRDHYKEEVTALQNTQQYRIGSADWNSGKPDTKVKIRVTEKPGKETKPDEKIVHLLEEEKNYYKNLYMEVEKQMKKKSKEVPKGAVICVDKEVSAIDDEFYRLREENRRLQNMASERDQLKKKIDEYENLLSEDTSKHDEKLKKAKEESAKLEKSVQKLQSQLDQEHEEVMRLRSELVLSARSPHHTTLNLMLQRMDRERNNATMELHQSGEETMQLQTKLQEMQDSHQSEKRKLQQQIEDLKATIFGCEKNRKTLESELLFHKKKLSSAEDESANLHYQLAQLQEDYNQNKIAANQMKLLAEKEEQSNAKLQSQLLQKEEQLLLAEEKIQTLEGKLKDLNNMIEHYNANVASLEAFVEKMGKERVQYQNLAEEKSHHLLSVQKEMFSKCLWRGPEEGSLKPVDHVVTEEQTSQLKITLTAMEAQLDKLQIDIRSKEQEIQRLKRQLEANAEQLESLNDTQEIQKRENKRLLEELAVLTRENQALSTELETVHSEQETMKRQIQEYVTEVARMEELIALKEQQRTELLQQYRSLNEENVQLETQTHQLATRNSSTELEVAAKQEELNICHHTISALRDEIEKHLANEYKYRQDVSKLNTSRTDLEAELEQTRDVLKDLQADLTASRALCTQLDSTRDQLQRQKANDEVEKQQLSFQVHDLQEENKNLRTQVTNERANVLNLEGVLAATREKEFRNHLSNQELTAEVKLLRERLQENEEKLEKQSKELAMYKTKISELEMKIERLKRQVTNEKFEKERTSQELRRLRQQHQLYISQTISRETTEFHPVSHLLPTTVQQYEMYSSNVSLSPLQLDAVAQTSPPSTADRQTTAGDINVSSASVSDKLPQTTLSTYAEKKTQQQDTEISSPSSSEVNGGTFHTGLKES